MNTMTDTDSERTSMPFDSTEWRSVLSESVNDDDSFVQAAEYFDGSLSFEIGDKVAWFKIYRGRIIDEEPYVPSFGASFRIVGDREAWVALSAGETSLSGAMYDGSIRARGNKLEANRLREAVELMVRHLQEISADEV